MALLPCSSQRWRRRASIWADCSTVLHALRCHVHPVRSGGGKQGQASSAFSMLSSLLRQARCMMEVPPIPDDVPAGCKRRCFELRNAHYVFMFVTPFRSRPSLSWSLCGRVSRRSRNQNAAVRRQDREERLAAVNENGTTGIYHQGESKDAAMLGKRNARTRIAPGVACGVLVLRTSGSRRSHFVTLFTQISGVRTPNFPRLRRALSVNC